MGKKILAGFLLIVALFFFGSVFFLQSDHFAGIVKSIVAKYVPNTWGIQGNFSGFKIGIFPPTISIRHPQVTVSERNVVNLPEGSAIAAERIDLKFFPLQMLTGKIRVHEAVIVNGQVKLSIDPEKLSKKTTKKKTGFGLSWEDVFQVRAESVVFENTRVELEWTKPSIQSKFNAKRLSVSQFSEESSRGIRLEIDVENLEAQVPKSWKVPRFLQKLKAKADFTETGVDVSGVSLESEGVLARIDGSVRGDLLAPKSLIMDWDLDLSAQIERLLAMAEITAPASGKMHFQGKVSGDLLHLSQSLKARGNLGLSDVKYQSWSADQVEVEGRWIAPTGEKEGEISIERGRISAAERDRGMGHDGRAGHGGEIQLGTFKIPLGAGGKMLVPIQFKNAHLHWLAAPGIKAVFPLDMRLNGSANVSVELPYGKRGWSLTSDLDFKIPHFVLDNQRIGKIKPLTKVFDIQELRLLGKVNADAKAVTAQELHVSAGKSGKTEFVANGRINYKTGYDLLVDGKVDLADLDRLADVPIRGVGDLNAHIHGPSSAVLLDFDADLKEAQYLDLSLGDLKGRITWDDDPQNLIFKNVRLKKGLTHYLGEGQIDLGLIEKVKLGFKIEKGDIFDINSIFEKQVASLWWFPTTLSGELNAEVQLSGGLKMSELIIQSKIRGSDWDFYGEKFKNITARAGYDRGTYYLEDVRASKYHGTLWGEISFNAQKGMEWDFKTEGLTLSDLDHVASLDVPIRGSLNILSSGAMSGGDKAALKSSTLFTLDDVVVRGRGLNSSNLTLNTADHVMTVRGRANGKEAALDWVYPLVLGKRSTLQARLTEFDFTPMLLFMNPSLNSDPAVAGRITGGIELNFLSGSVELSDGNIELGAYSLKKKGFQYLLVDAVSSKIKGGTYALQNIRLRGPTGDARVNIRGQAGALAGNIEGSADLQLAEFLTPTIERTSGVADLNFTIGGKLKDPLFFGQASFKGGQVGIQSFDSPLENITGYLQLKQNLLTAKGIEGRMAGGRVFIDGKAEFFPNKVPTLDFSANIQDSRLKIFPFQYVRTSGKLNLKGDHFPYLITGSVRTNSALIKEKIFQQRATGSRRAVRYTPPPSSFYEQGRQMFKLQIEAQSDGGILVQNDLFDAELKGKVEIINTIQVPRIVGTAEMIRGKMSFKDRHFQIDSGRVEFDNPAVINPKFDFSGKTQVKDTKIQLYASGRMNDFKIDLSSDPAMPESDILQLLAVGYTSGDLQRFGTQDQSALQQGEAASLLLHSFDFNRDVRDKTGFEIEVGSAVNTKDGASIFRPQVETDAAAAPKIVIKRKIGQRVDLSVGSTVGVGTTNEREVNAEVQMTPGVSVIGIWNSFESLNSQEESQTSYGVDLKFQKRFK